MIQILWNIVVELSGPYDSHAGDLSSVEAFGCQDLFIKAENQVASKHDSRLEDNTSQTPTLEPLWISIGASQRTDPTRDACYMRMLDATESVGTSLDPEDLHVINTNMKYPFLTNYFRSEPSLPGLGKKVNIYFHPNSGSPTYSPEQQYLTTTSSLWMLNNE